MPKLTIYAKLIINCQLIDLEEKILDFLPLSCSESLIFYLKLYLLVAYSPPLFFSFFTFTEIVIDFQPKLMKYICGDKKLKCKPCFYEFNLYDQSLRYCEHL